LIFLTIRQKSLNSIISPEANKGSIHTPYW